MLTFISSFILYLITMFPGVAPYRDTGEMASVAATLGIAHPPGYPLYTLMSHIFVAILPYGTAGFRLNVLSALFGSCTVWVMYKIIRVVSRDTVKDELVIVLIPLILASSYLQWYLSLVSEMYTINTFFAAWLMYLVISPSSRLAPRIYLILFVFGLGLGIRMDLVMIAPLIAVPIWANRRSLSVGNFAAAMGFFVAGLSVFLYLPIRSHTIPLLDWNHPATIERLWGTITRKTHGGTLDLVSATFAPGENFVVCMKFYADHLLKGFAYLGIPLALFGLYQWWKTNRLYAAGSLFSWLIAGPLFIYKANMPPNPHALAILEAHFLLPNLIIFLWVAMGFMVWQKSFSGRRVPLVAVAILCMVGVNLHANLPELCKRNNFIAFDYAKNILRSLPHDSVVVMKKDVQLFALWNQQLAQNRRRDVFLVSQGLSGSPWYQDSWGRQYPSTTLGPLTSEDQWRDWIAHNAHSALYVSDDADYPRPAGISEMPAGLLSCIGDSRAGSSGNVLMDDIYCLRGLFQTASYREFFTPDIISDYSMACLSLGQYLFNERKYPEARQWMSAAVQLQPLFPAADNFIGFSYVQQGNTQQALEYYHRAAEGFSTMHDLSVKYRSLSDVQTGLLNNQSEALLAVGVCEERLGNEQQAIAAYRQSIECWPANAHAHFDLAVIYWKHNDWSSVISELENALRIDPNYREAMNYLALARQKFRNQGLPPG